MSRVVRTFEIANPIGLDRPAMALGAAAAAGVFACHALQVALPISWMWAVFPLGAAGLFRFPAHLEVGGDGYRVVWLGRSSYVSFHDVQSIVAVGSSSRVRLTSGRTSVLRAVVPPEDSSKDAAVEGDDLRREIEEVWSSFQEHAKKRVLVDGGEHARIDGYRAAGLRDDDVWGVVEDPSAVPGERLKAAIALRDELGQDTCSRLYEAAAFVANPPLRAALEKVAQGAASSQQRTPVE
jgi:hypothetical protein